MPSLKNALSASIQWLLYVLFIGGVILAILDEGFRFFRGRYNTKGTSVHGFALYEKDLPPPPGMEKMMEKWPFPKTAPGWKYFDFYPHSFECEFYRWRKQSTWEDEREGVLKTRPGAKPIWREDELPLIRYKCAPSPIFYQAGQGWGLF
jgi:hypothetical protein